MIEKKAFVIDISRCCGCYNCQIACKDEHVDNEWLPYAKPQPNTGQFWLKLNEYERGTLPKVKLHYIPVMCAHCENAICMKVCDAGAIYRREDGIVIIDPEKCTGCRECLSACPYGAVYFNEEYNIAQKCTGCAHLLDNGWKEPRCVGVCPTGALRFVKETELGDIPQHSTDLNPCGAGPRAYYINVPGRFVAGTVIDSNKMEVITGAGCNLKTVGGIDMKTVTDGFGDFWFNDVPKGVCELEISEPGYKTLVLKTEGEECENLGDIALKNEKI